MTALYVPTATAHRSIAAGVVNKANPFQQLCVNNMNLIANTEFSCPAGDTACFCSRSNWAYGIRDCSRQACDAEQAGQAISYAAGLCEGESPSLHAR